GHASVRAKLEQFIAAHKAGGERFRRGLEIFKSSKFDQNEGDNAVQGLDSAATALLVEAHKEASDLGAKATDDAVKSAESSYRMAIVGTVIAMLGALAALWVFF